MAIRTLFCILALVAFSRVEAATHEDLVVTVEARQASESKLPDETGAGIIVSQTPTRTIVITAFHVVAPDRNLLPDIRVEFRSARGRLLSARTHPSYVDRDMDLAVLIIDASPSQPVPRMLTDENRRSISPSAPKALENSKVSIMGTMGSRRWVRGLLVDTVLSGTEQALSIQSATAAAGASGGAVFDSLGRLVGMSSSVQDGKLRAVPIHTAINRLTRWGVEVGLQRSEVGSTSSDVFQQIRDGVVFMVAVTEPPPLPHSPAAWPRAGEGSSYQFRITLQLSDSLRDIRPRVIIKFPEHPGVAANNAGRDNMEFQAPNYSLDVKFPAVRLAGEILLVLPDGRTVGTVPKVLDFERPATEAARRYGDVAVQAIAKSQEMFKWYESMGRESQQRQKSIMDNIGAQQAATEENRLRNHYTNFPSELRTRCEMKSGSWFCDGLGLPTQPKPYGSLANVFHSIKIGTSADNLPIHIPLDSAVDVRKVMAGEIMKLLSRPSTKEVYAEMMLTTGVRIGPSRMCMVSTVRDWTGCQ